MTMQTVTADPWWIWWLSADVVGIATWIGVIVAVIGVPIGGWALVIAVQEARGARRAAEAAELAVSTMQIFGEAADAAYASGQLEVVRQLMTARSFEVAQAVFPPIKRSLGLSTPSSSDEQKAWLLRTMDILETQLAKAASNGAGFNEARALRALGGLTQYVTEWEAQIRVASRTRSMDSAND